MAGWHHEGCFKFKSCKVCGELFQPKSGSHQFCSSLCKGRWKYVSGQMDTDRQYKYVSGDWRRYFNRLRCRSKTRMNLTTDELIELLQKQSGKCALSGRELTCELVKGQRSWANASLDRIHAGGPYSIGNVQLVCAALNQWRGQVPLDEYIDWCRAVANHAGVKNG